MWKELNEHVAKVQTDEPDKAGKMSEIDMCKMNTPPLTKDNVYTLEVSFAGQTDGNHFTAEAYRNIGRGLLNALGVYTKL